MKLLGIALAESYYEEAIAAHAPQHEQEGEGGVSTMGAEPVPWVPWLVFELPLRHP